MHGEADQNDKYDGCQSSDRVGEFYTVKEEEGDNSSQHDKLPLGKIDDLGSPGDGHKSQGDQGIDGPHGDTGRKELRNIRPSIHEVKWSQKRGETISFTHPLIYHINYIFFNLYSNPGNLILLNLPPSIRMKTISFLLKPSWSVGL